MEPTFMICGDDFMQNFSLNYQKLLSVFIKPPGSRDGPGSCDQTLAVEEKKLRPQILLFFF